MTTSETAEEWVSCLCGRRHWGRHGAAGVLVEAAGTVLLQLRADWSSDGGTWGLPGGARKAGEKPVQAALREAGEETALQSEQLRLTGTWAECHGPWSYTTVLASAPRPLRVDATDSETADVRWVPLSEVEQLPLHPGLAAAWARLRPAVGVAVQLVVDVANVMGSRPDGWWRDRAAAAARLANDIAAWSREPVDDRCLPEELSLPSMDEWYVTPTLVVEGAARKAVAPPHLSPDAPCTVVPAAADGDDAVVEVVSSLTGANPVLVITADRELRRRTAELGAVPMGPRWLLDRL